MKRQILLLMCLCILLAGCSKAPIAETSASMQPTFASTLASLPPETEVTDSEETIPQMAYHKPFTAVSLTPYGDSITAQDGTTLYRYTTQSLTLVMNDHAIAQSIIEDFNGSGNRTLQAATVDLEVAEAEYTGQSDWFPYFYDMQYTVPRLDQAVLSLSGHQLFYDGTQRSGESIFAFNYDMQTGIRLRLQDVLEADFSADTLVDLIVASLADVADYLYSDYTDSIAGLFHSNAPVENWYFTESGLCFFFNPYEIAPQREGIIFAEVPYTQLPGILKDAYFADEAVEFYGTVEMAPFADTDISQISQFAEIILDASGNQYLLCPRGTVLDVTVQTGTWTKNGTFAASATVFVAEALSLGNALMLQLPAEDLGSLCVTYRSGGELIQTPWQIN